MILITNRYRGNLPSPFTHSLTFQLNSCHCRLHTYRSNTRKTNGKLRIRILQKSHRSNSSFLRQKSLTTRGSSHNRLLDCSKILFCGRLVPPVPSGRSFGSSSSSLLAVNKFQCILMNEKMFSVLRHHSGRSGADIDAELSSPNLLSNSLR